MGGHGYCRIVVAVALAAAGQAEAQALLSRVSLSAPTGYAEVAATAETREWAPARAAPDAATRVVLLDRPRESWDDAASVLKRLHRLLKDNCPQTKLETVSRPPPAHADAAVRGILYCPSHDASGRGLVVVEDVIVVGDRMLIAKLAYDLPPFSPGVKPLGRKQRATAYAVLDSITLLPAAPRVLPP